MALFTVRDRIAIAVLAGVILAGWGVRLGLHHEGDDTVRVIHGSVQPPAPPELRPAAAVSAVTDSAAAAPPPVDINRAGAPGLDTLPMIGPAKAEAIIRYRVEHGPFSKTADIMKVKGIGPGIFARIEKRITVGDSAGAAVR